MHASPSIARVPTTHATGVERVRRARADAGGVRLIGGAGCDGAGLRGDDRGRADMRGQCQPGGRLADDGQWRRLRPGRRHRSPERRRRPFGTATAGPAGSFSIVMPAPILGTLKPGEAAVPLSAEDETSDDTTAATTFTVANLAVSRNPVTGEPSEKATWKFSGFTSGAEIYAHYLHGTKVTGTAKFGRASGPCGLLRKRAQFYPGKAKYDTYMVQIDDSPRFSPSSFPRVDTQLRIRTT